MSATTDDIPLVIEDLSWTMKAIDWHNFFSLFGVPTLKVDLYDLLHLQSKDDGQKFALKAITLPCKRDKSLMNCKSHVSNDVFVDVRHWCGTGNRSYHGTNQLEQAAFFCRSFLHLIDLRSGCMNWNYR
jgi:hypothetical protein